MATPKYKSKNVFCKVPKLLTKFCSNEIKFAIDEVGYCNTNSVYNCELKIYIYYYLRIDLYENIMTYEYYISMYASNFLYIFLAFREYVFDRK